MWTFTEKKNSLHELNANVICKASVCVTFSKFLECALILH